MGLFGKNYKTNELFVSVVGNHQAFILDENNKYSGYSKAVPTSERDIVLKENEKHISVVNGRVYDPSMVDEKGCPQLLFIYDSIPFNEYFTEYTKPTISEKLVKTYYSKLNTPSSESEPGEEE